MNSGGPTNERLRQRVTELRKQKGWTLDGLSKACDVSRSMLSQIERGQANPTLALAYRISQAFNVSIADLIEDPHDHCSINVIKATDKSHVFRSDKDCIIRTLSPLNHEKSVEFYEVELKGGCTLSSGAHFSGTQEYVVCQSGNIRVTSGEESHELETGDSAHYPADVSHALENLTDDSVRCYLVVTYAK